MNFSKKAPNKKEQTDVSFEDVMFEFMEKKYSISKTDFLNIVKTKNSLLQNTEKTFPLHIIATGKLSSLEAIVKFLRENRNLPYAELGKLVNRNPKTLATTYKVAHEKMPEKFLETNTTNNLQIPFTIFEKNLSILESICTYLKSQNNNYAKIACMIKKDQRTVWTVCKRAEKKLEKSKIKKIKNKIKNE